MTRRRQFDIFGASKNDESMATSQFSPRVAFRLPRRVSLMYVAGAAAAETPLEIPYGESIDTGFTIQSFPISQPSKVNGRLSPPSFGFLRLSSPLGATSVFFASSLRKSWICTGRFARAPTNKQQTSQAFRTSKTTRKVPNPCQFFVCGIQISKCSYLNLNSVNLGLI